MYARVLGLQYLRPSNLLCFAFFEGAIALAALLALAELAQWWVVLVLPLSVAAMVKLNDVIAGAVFRAGSARMPRALGRAVVPAAAAPVRRRRAAGDRMRDESHLDKAGWGGGWGEVAPTSPAGADEWFGSREQRARQSATRRYE
jgi:predicted secreted protein